MEEERTLEERERDIRARWARALYDIEGVRSRLGELVEECEDIEADALDYLWNGLGYDPRLPECECPEAEDVESVYLGARSMTGTMETLQRIFGALV